MNVRGRNKESKISIVIFLILCSIAVSIGYASFSRTLDISGEATVNKSSWKVQFQNLSDPIVSGANNGATVSVISKPTISDDGKTIGSYNVSFTTPGDTVSFTFEVANLGTFNAELSSADIPVPTCTGYGDNSANDAANVCKNLVYSLTYEDGSALNIHDTLNVDQVRKMKLTLTYKESITDVELPHDDVTVSNLAITLNYSQV
ncbi:MAG: hypothetical protein PUB90_01650 [bacterium]|nr:hypothetical protein [bacterium]